MKLRFLFVALFVLFSLGAYSQRSIEVRYEVDCNGSIKFVCDNYKRCDQILKVKFPVLENLKANRALPFISTVPPGKSTLFTLTKINLRNGIEFRYDFVHADGKYKPKIKADFPYLIPVENGKKVKTKEVNGHNRMVSIRNKAKFYSYGFEMNAGDTIYAARAGAVCDIFGKSRVNKSPVMTKKDVAVRVYHKDGTFGKYFRVDGNNLFVELGQQINAGDPIGLVYHDYRFNGKPFVVFTLSRTDYDRIDDFIVGSKIITPISLPVMFVNNQTELNILKPETEYISSHTPEVITKEMGRRKRKKWLKAHKG